MKRKITSADVKSLLNSIAIKRDEMTPPNIDSAPEPLSDEDATAIGLISAIGVITVLVEVFAVVINEKIKEKIKNMPIDCLKLYNDPLIQELLAELKHLCDIFNQFANTPGDVPANIFEALSNTTAEDIILDAIEDVLKKIKGLIADLSLGKCGKIWGDILSDIFSLGLGIPPWISDTIRKVMEGVIDASIAIGCILEQYSPQLAAAWAARAVIKSYQAQPQILQNPGISWGTVGIALGIVGVGILTVYTGGAAAGILLGVIGGVAGNAMADIPPEQIQKEVQDRIEQQKCNVGMR